MKDLTFADYYRVLREGRKTILYAVLVAAIATPVLCLVLPKKYTTFTTLLPIASGEGAAGSIMGGSIASILKGNLGNMLESNSTKKLWSIMTSRSVGTRVVQELHLDRIFFKDDWDEARQTWKKPEQAPRPEDVFNFMVDREIVRFEEDDKGLTRIVVTYRDPALITKIANTYASAIRDVLNQTSPSISKRTRVFLEEQSKRSSVDVKNTLASLDEFNTKNPGYTLSSTEQNLIKTMSNLEGQTQYNDLLIRMYEQQMRGSATELDNLINRRSELREKAKKFVTVVTQSISNKNDVPSDNYDALLIRRTQDPLRLNALRLHRMAMTTKKVDDLIQGRLEQARIDEEQDVGFKIVDEALEPRSPMFPKPMIFTAAAIVLAFLLSATLLFSKNFIAQVQEDPSDQVA